MKLNFFNIFFSLFLLLYTAGTVTATSIDSIAVQTTGNIEKYAKFEVSFKINGSTYTNPFVPYDTVAFAQIPSGAGISVNSLFLAPSKTSWTDAKKFPCFYYQPYDANLMPIGSADWRCRFTPEIVGTWQYKMQVTDKNGTIESSAGQFNVIDSTRKGFVKVSSRDTKSFEFSDGSAFPWSLVTVNPLRNGSNLQSTISKMGQNGIKFVRWFPTREDGNVNVFSDNMNAVWQNFPGNVKGDIVDIARGKNFSFEPYYYTQQHLYLQSGQKYKISLRVYVEGEQALSVQLANAPTIFACSATNSQDTTNCNSNNKKNGWNDYSTTFTANTTGENMLYLHGLYSNSDAPTPYNSVRSGAVRVSDITLQRDETGNGGWGANMIHKGNPDTYLYMDQNEAAVMDEILKASETSGVYHKLTLFHKNDEVMNYLGKDGNVVPAATCGGSYCALNFYSADGYFPRWIQKAYMRYFLARWGYSTAIHSLEYVNESDITTEAFNAGFMYAKFIKENQPRNILVTNSFWGWWNAQYFADPTYGQYIDYGDKHWYSNTDSNNTELISTIWQDTVANVRQCYTRFKEYAAGDPVIYKKPIVRGETGVGITGTGPLHPSVKSETTGVYFHKKVWSHTGILGYSCDGEWYPEIFSGNGTNSFPNATYDIYKIYATYDKFISGEPLNNGSHVDLGVDLTGTNQIVSSNSTLRAYGSKDPITSRVLVWIDNKNNTWQNASYSTNDSSTFTISGLPQGSYTKETWDTRAGTFTKTDNAVTVGSNGSLQFTAATSKDIAFKFYISGFYNPTPTLSPTSGACSLKSSGDADCNGVVNLVDFEIWRKEFTGSLLTKTADFNGDNTVNLIDFEIWRKKMMNG